MSQHDKIYRRLNRQDQQIHLTRVDALRETQLEQGAEIRELRSEMRMEAHLIRSDMREGFTEVNGRVGSLETDVATLKTDVSTLKTDVNTLQDGVAELLRRTA